MLDRSTDRSATVTSRRTLSPRILLAASLVMLLSLATAAAGQGESADVQLNMSVGGVGTRALAVTNVLGQPLDELTLTSGIGANYRATVTDLDYLIGEGFNLYSETGNLYPVTSTGPTVVDTDSHQIDSEHVTVNLTQGLSAANVLADINTEYLLGIVGDLANCATALNALPEVAAALLDDLTITAEVTAICTALAAVDTAAVTDAIPVAGPIIEDLDLDALLDDVLGLADGIAATTPFTNPSFLGLGAPDGPGTDPATQVSLMIATPPALDTITADLLAAINALITDVTGQDVTAVIDAADAAQALVDHTADATVVTLGNAIGAIDDAVAQEAILNTVLDIANGVVDLSILDNLFGVYTAYPVLTATPPLDTPEGAYAGTHTVTLVSN